MRPEREQLRPVEAARLLARATHVVFRSARLTRGRVARRLLVVGGFLVFGWLLSGVHSAYAADDSPLSVPAVAGKATTDVVGDAVDTVKATVEDNVKAVVRDAAAPAKGRAPASVKAGVADTAGKVKAPPARTTTKKTKNTTKQSPADQVGAAPARTVAGSLARIPSGGTAREDVTPGHAVRGGADGVLGTVEGAVSAVSAGAPALPNVGAVETTGLVDPVVARLSSSATKTIGSLTDTLDQPLGSHPAPLGSLTPLSAPVTTLTGILGPLGPLGSLSILTEPVLGSVFGTVGRLGELAALAEHGLGVLVSGAGGVLAPLTSAPARLVGAAETATTGIVAPAGSAPTRPLGASLGAGTGSASVCPWAIPPLLCANADVLTLDEVTLPLGTAEGAPQTGDASRPMPGFVPRSAFHTSASILRSAPATDAPAPMPPFDPRSGTPSHAILISSHGDGLGDPPRQWEARVLVRFVPAWVVASPAIRYAADEPGFSPD